MSRNIRLNQIVSAVVENGSIEVAALSELFHVSSATIRRDLETLEQRRLVTRTHGGATPHTAFVDVPLGYKSEQDRSEKRRIAERALEFVEDSRVIGLTGGTTITMFARLLDVPGDLTVVTNALNIATDLISKGSLRVFAAGGEVRSSSQETVGSTAESFIAAYNIDVAFLGVDGVDAAAGCTSYDPSGGAVNTVLHQRAQTTVVLADASKISRVALAKVCDMADVDFLITDSRASDVALSAIRALGCEVILV